MELRWFGARESLKVLLCSSLPSLEWFCFGIVASWVVSLYYVSKRHSLLWWIRVFNFLCSKFRVFEKCWNYFMGASVGHWSYRCFHMLQRCFWGYRCSGKGVPEVPSRCCRRGICQRGCVISIQSHQGMKFGRWWHKPPCSSRFNFGANSPRVASS